jgi:hypothetical protein
MNERSAWAAGRVRIIAVTARNLSVLTNQCLGKEQMLSTEC